MQVTFSGKHNGLYLYFSRLVRPVWLKTLVAPSPRGAQLESSVSGEEVDWINSKLMELKGFIEKNAQVVAAAAPAINQTVADASQVSQILAAWNFALQPSKISEAFCCFVWKVNPYIENNLLSLRLLNFH